MEPVELLPWVLVFHATIGSKRRWHSGTEYGMAPGCCWPVVEERSIRSIHHHWIEAALSARSIFVCSNRALVFEPKAWMIVQSSRRFWNLEEVKT